MEKLTLKEIAGYADKDVLIEITQFEQKQTIVMKGFTQYKGEFTIWSEWSGYGKSFDKKPILYPLEMLTKTIVHNGETFVPMHKLKNGGTDSNEYRYLEWKGYSAIDNEEHETCYDEKSKSFLQFFRGESRQCANQLEKFQKLYEWHFDIHGLIERGLAIDKSTLNRK